MWISTDALLIWGVRLGGPDKGFNVDQAGRFGELNVSWWSEDDDFAEAIEKTLGRDAGVEVVETQHPNVPDYFLAARHYEAAHGHPQRIVHFEATEKMRVDLAAALLKLGLTPKEPPGWYLTSWSDF